MNGYNHPDDLYAAALDKVREHTTKPTGDYQAPPELSASERKLRTALAYVNHARDLIRDVLGDNEPKAQREAKIAYDMESDGRLPKWHQDYPKSQHPMNGEVIRDHDERLQGPEDVL